MSIGDATRPRPTKPAKIRTLNVPPRLLRLLSLLAVALFGLVLMTVALVAGYQLFYRTRIHRGVQVWDLDLGGKRRDEAQAALSDYFAHLTQLPWELRDGERAWQVTPPALGVRFDATATAEAAYAVGRSRSLAWNLGEQIRSVSQGMPVAPVVLYDETAARNYLLGLADEIQQPVRDASLTINGFNIYETGAQVGRQLDVEATLVALRAVVGDLDQNEVQLVVIETFPRVIDAAIARDQAQAITAAPLTLYVADGTLTGTLTRTNSVSQTIPGPWQWSREDLAAMLQVSEEPVGDDGTVRLNVTLDPNAVGARLSALSQEVSRTATNARFIFNDDTRQLEVIAPSSDGLELDLEATAARVSQQVASTEREVPLILKLVPAEFNENLTTADLGIIQLVASSTSYFAGSSEGRVNNVTIAASRFHGLVIRPGQTFSFNEWLGEVSEEEGYDESLIIFGNETIPDVGGGICQVSTTAFRAAFWAGFPIAERWAHAYRVGYYEQGDHPIGTDATVYSPFVDFKFVNDSPYHLLIETYVSRSASSLTFKFYSTGNGRVVEMEGPIVSDVIEHGDPVYKEDAKLAPGEIKQIEWATNGMTVVVTRVIRDTATDAVVERKEFKSKFRPWNAVYLVGPGTEVPGHDVIRLDQPEGEESAS